MKRENLLNLLKPLHFPLNEDSNETQQCLSTQLHSLTSCYRVKCDCIDRQDVSALTHVFPLKSGTTVFQKWIMMSLNNTFDKLWYF